MFVKLKYGVSETETEARCGTPTQDNFGEKRNVVNPSPSSVRMANFVGVAVISLFSNM